MCGHPPPLNCNPDFGKTHFPQLRAALQNMLAAGLCHCSHTYGQKQAESRVTSLQSCKADASLFSKAALSIWVHILPSTVLQCSVLAHCCHAKQGNISPVNTCAYLLLTQACSGQSQTQCSTQTGGGCGHACVTYPHTRAGLYLLRQLSLLALAAQRWP